MPTPPARSEPPKWVSDALADVRFPDGRNALESAIQVVYECGAEVLIEFNRRNVVCPK